MQLSLSNKFIKRISFLLAFLCILLLAIKLFYVKKVTKVEDNYVYNLPYSIGTSYKVVQGYGGLFSHNGIAAIDFAMPERTLIYAARQGVIYAYKESETVGGPLAKYTKNANYIMIKHDDGSYGCYWHLQHNGVVVKKGKVGKGQLIGYSGATGFVLNPHLHFSVKRKLVYESNVYVKTKFATKEGVQFLESGTSYERPN
jgi:murein DD-endopeptidase MepM/ murein hydrolase activator NlpD